jgi:predicted O-methyltransferase YrrM
MSQNKHVVDAVATQLNDEVDFMFIDGDHTYEGVKKDWELYSPMVRKGGVIAFHDIIEARPHIGVGRLFEELKEEHGHEALISDPSQDCCGIGIIWK